MSKKTSHYLHKDSVFYGRYIIKKILKEDDIFITYGAYDKLWKNKVAIMEYFPKNLCVRDELFDQLVKLRKYEYQKIFYDRRQAVLNAARTMMDFHHEDGLLSVTQYVEMNNTAYIIMEYERSVSFRDTVADQKTIKCDRLLALMKPLFLAVAALHKRNIYHGYITPDTVRITEKDRMFLDDFGTVIPDSVYYGEPRLKPGNDVAMLAALVYHGLTGNEYTIHLIPTQIREDMEARDIPKHVTEAVIKALSTGADAYKTVKSFADHLYDESFIDPQKDETLTSKAGSSAKPASQAANRPVKKKSTGQAVPDRPLPQKPIPVYDRGLSTRERPKTVWEEESLPEKLADVFSSRQKAQRNKSQKKTTGTAKKTAPVKKTAQPKRTPPPGKTGKKPAPGRKKVVLIICIIILLYNMFSLLLSGIISHRHRIFRQGDDQKQGTIQQVSEGSIETDLSLKTFTLLGTNYVGPVTLKDFTENGWEIHSLYYFDSSTKKVEVTLDDTVTKGKFYNAELKNADIMETMYISISTYYVPDGRSIALGDMTCGSIKIYSTNDIDFNVNGLGIGSTVPEVGMFYNLDISNPDEVDYLFVRNKTEGTQIYFSFDENRCKYFSVEFPETY